MTPSNPHPSEGHLVYMFEAVLARKVYSFSNPWSEYLIFLVKIYNLPIGFYWHYQKCLVDVGLGLYNICIPPYPYLLYHSRLLLHFHECF